MSAFIPENIVTAIENAKCQMAGKYGNKFGEAQCIIGQIGILHGIKPSEWKEDQSIDDRAITLEKPDTILTL